MENINEIEPSINSKINYLEDENGSYKNVGQENFAFEDESITKF